MCNSSVHIVLYACSALNYAVFLWSFNTEKLFIFRKFIENFVKGSNAQQNLFPDFKSSSRVRFPEPVDGDRPNVFMLCNRPIRCLSHEHGDRKK